MRLSSTLRLSPLLLCVALAGCAGADAKHELSPAAAAARGAVPGSAAKKEWWQEGPMTREKAASMCWMRYDSAHRNIALEARADLVGKCVAATMKGRPPR
jgi:hypothetical protein